MKRILSLILAASAAACSSAQMNLENSILTVELLDGQATDSIKAVQYFDGLGRSEESVTGGASPVGSYLHSRNVYDALGREIQEWLPVASGTINMLGKQTFINESYSWYADSIGRITMRYDGLGRVIEYNRPGTAWKGRPQVTAYSTNADNEVKQYAVEGDEPVLKGYYSSGTLSLTTSIDEDQDTVSVYRDLLGNTILERRANSFDTYHVYDEQGRLRFVLQPMYQDDPDTDAYAFRYTYDDEGRIATRKLPGCEPEHYWYDAGNRMIRMQDGELSSKGRYRVYGYDGLGRLTSQSLAFANGDIEYDEVVNHYDTYDFLNLYTAVTDSGTISSHLRGDLNNSTGKLTGVEQRASNGESLLATYAYDPFGRISRNGIVGLKGHLTVCDFEYNFVGDITHERYREYGLTGSTYGRTLNAHIEKKYDYLHTKLPGSSVITLHSPISGVSASDTIMNLTYDDFGRIATMDRGGTAADMTFTYDLQQGWIKEIRSSGGFEQRLYREDNTGHELYNGSISAMTWKVPGQNYVRRYDYTYDGMNRLVEGAYSHLRVFTPLPGIISSTGEEILAMGESSPLSLIPVIDTPGDLVGPISINAADRYTERISYDKNSNITSLERYGMNNQHYYGLIDSLVITRNGNQLKAIEDHAEKRLTYTGASDFYDGCTYSNEYSYNDNGALDMDQNRDIDMIMYDRLGNTREIWFYDHSNIEYIYAADGTKLRTIHRPASSSALTDSIDYIGNLILKNGQPSMYLFDGGYATFNQSGAVNGWHYYIQDYMGNNRMVVNKNGTKEQVTHYYPYGGVIGDISTNESVQKYKFEGKELDRTFGLDNYDIHARQYFAMMPTWDRIDGKAEDYYHVSPYAYCLGNPVNLFDNNGKQPTKYIDNNGNKRITWSVVVMVRALKDDASYKAISKHEQYKQELKDDYLRQFNHYLNGDGNGAKNSLGESVFSEFNIYVVDVPNPSDEKTANKLSVEYGQEILNPRNGQNGRAAVFMEGGTRGASGLTRGTKITIANDAIEGTESHELYHTTGIGDNGYIQGGILNSPPEPISPSEVDEMWNIIPEKKVRTMKKILSIAFFCTTISFLFGQDNQKYIVFIFNYRWTSGGWNTGDFLWAIPYDSCHNPIDNNNIIPLFAEEGQILDLNDSVISNQSFGEWPVGDYLPKGSDLWSLYRNRRLIHKIDYKYIPDKRKRTTNIYMVPIIAKISKRKFGYYKEDIFLLESLDNIWEEFWGKEDETWHYILQHDFCGFNFIVSPGYSFNR